MMREKGFWHCTPWQCCKFFRHSFQEEPDALRNLRVATDFVLKATEKMAQGIKQNMGFMV